MMTQDAIDVLREMLIEKMTDLICEADVELNGEHPYWDDATVSAMADAVLAVVMAIDAAEHNILAAG